MFKIMMLVSMISTFTGDPTPTKHVVKSPRKHIVVEKSIYWNGNYIPEKDFKDSLYFELKRINDSLKKDKLTFSK
jgi:hypothetical protein